MSLPLPLPEGFQFLGKHVGIKEKAKDFAIAVSDSPCVAAAMFTTNSCCGECIPLGRQAISNHILQAVMVTSGIANVATGAEGRQVERRLIDRLAEKLDLDPADILPSSTGVIGPQLPESAILAGMEDLSSLSKEGYSSFAEAIITTDKAPKIVSKRVGDATILGIAKGAGMIEPNMATMLVYLFTDAIIPQEQIQELLKESVNVSFNSLSIDTDTSTSDTVVLMANCRKEVDLAVFSTTLTEICIDLARQIAVGAEGAEHLIEATVSGCRTDIDALKVGKSIINSPLIKTAVYGADPNWGRIVMAIGKTSSVQADLSKLSIAVCGEYIYVNGNAQLGNLETIRGKMIENKVITIEVDLANGEFSHTVYGCDLTPKYVEINSEYSS